MASAMMLPTVLPLLRLFDRLIAARPDRSLLVGLLIAGYLLAWVAFGIAAHLLDAALHEDRAAFGWLADHGWIPARPSWRSPARSSSAGSSTVAWTSAARPSASSPSTGAAPRQRRAVPCSACITALLRRLLLGHHAADVRRRHRQRRLDAHPGRHHGRREERPLGPASKPPTELYCRGRRLLRCQFVR